MKNKFNSQNFLYLILLFTVITISIFLDNEVLHPESSSFICNYLREQPLKNLIFDPLSNDWGLYQGREFSYLIDFFDVKFIALCAKMHCAHFFSISYFICCIGVICIQQYYGCQLFRNLSKIQIFACSMIFVTLPNILTGVSFFRSSKALTSLFICIICYMALLLFKRGTIHSITNNRRIITVIIICEILLVVSDKQGVFFVAVFGIIMAMFLLFGFLLPPMSRANGRSLLALAIGSAGVIFISVLYNGLICPAIIHACNGYFPDFSYQKSQAADLKGIINGLETFFRFVGVMGGSLGIWSGFAVILGIIIMLLYPVIKKSSGFKSRLFSQQVYFSAVYILLISATAVMFILMVQRHSYLATLPELQCSNYSMPLNIILIFFLSLALNYLQMNRSNKFKNTVTLLLLLLSMINLMSLQHYSNLQHNGHLKFNYLRTPYIKYQINAESDRKNYHLLLPDEARVIQVLSKHQKQ